MVSGYPAGCGGRRLRELKGEGKGFVTPRKDATEEAVRMKQKEHRMHKPHAPSSL